MAATVSLAGGGAVQGTTAGHVFFVAVLTVSAARRCVQAAMTATRWRGLWVGDGAAARAVDEAARGVDAVQAVLLSSKRIP